MDFVDFELHVCLFIIIIVFIVFHLKGARLYEPAGDRGTAGRVPQPLVNGQDLFPWLS